MACLSLIGNISLYGTKTDGKLPVISVLDSVQCSYLLSWCSLLFRAIDTGPTHPFVGGISSHFSETSHSEEFADGEATE